MAPLNIGNLGGKNLGKGRPFVKMQDVVDFGCLLECKGDKAARKTLFSLYSHAIKVTSVLGR